VTETFAARNSDEQRYQQWYSLLQRTFGREPAQTEALTRIALSTLDTGGKPDDALAAAHIAATVAMGVVPPPVVPELPPIPPLPPADMAAPPAPASDATLAPSTTTALTPREVLVPTSTPTAPTMALPTPVGAQPKPGPSPLNSLLYGVALLVFLPLGLYLLWRDEALPQASKRRVTAVVLVCFAVIVGIIVVVGHSLNSTNRT
jgi:hypothetical protein